MSYCYPNVGPSAASTTGYGEEHLDWASQGPDTSTDSTTHFSPSSSAVGHENDYFASEIYSPESTYPMDMDNEGLNEQELSYEVEFTFTPSGDTREAMVEAAITQAKINLETYPRPAMTQVTDDAVLPSSPDESPAAAVGRVLSSIILSLPLSDPYLGQINAMLVEAATQILARVDGNEADNICRYSLLTVVARMAESATGLSFPSTACSRKISSSGAKQHVCLHPDCKGSAFARAADLDRHYSNVHDKKAREKKTFVCDYKKCNRHKNPFSRVDHFRDHLRDFHKEDLVPRSVAPSREWWESRSGHAVLRGWWRCNRCLRRVDRSREGYICECGSGCESERQEYRKAVGGVSK